MANVIQTFPKGGSPTYSGLPDKPTVNNIDIETLSIEGMDVADNSGVTEISAPGLNADSLADVTSGEITNYAVTNGNTYSTDEQIIGRWVDGKPIYQRTLYINQTFTLNTTELDTFVGGDLTSWNIKNVIAPVTGFTPSWNV